jgi:hypothetical protein
MGANWIALQLSALVRRSSCTASLVLVALALAGEGVARADSQEARLAQALFEEARALMASKRFPEACLKLAESQRLDPATGTLLNLAVCHEEEGRLAAAMSEFREVAAASTRERRADRRVVAEQHLAALEKLVPKLSVTVSPRAQALAGLEVRLDGLELRPAAWGVAAPVDPGPHTVTATAANRQPWTTTVIVARGEIRPVDVDDPVAPEAEPAVAGGLGLAGGTAGVPPTPPPLPPNGTTEHNPVRTVLTASSVVGFGTFVVAGTVSLLAYLKRSNAGCIPERDYCYDQGAKDAYDRERTFGWLSTGGLLLGIGTAVALSFVPARVPVRVSVGVAPGAAFIGGRF